MGQSYCYLVSLDQCNNASQLCRYSVDRGICFLIDELQAGSAELEAPRYALRINHVFINLCFLHIIACRQRGCRYWRENNSCSGLRRQPCPSHIHSAASSGRKFVKGCRRYIKVCGLAANAYIQDQHMLFVSIFSWQCSHRSTTFKSTLLLSPTCSSYLDALSFRPHSGF